MSATRSLDVTTVPEQATLGKTDSEQLKFATYVGRCILVIPMNGTTSAVDELQGIKVNPSKLVTKKQKLTEPLK